MFPLCGISVRATGCNESYKFVDKKANIIIFKRLIIGYNAIDN
jgi:hypothetical protein